MNANKPVSKVLVLDDCPAHADAIKRFCGEHNLIALKARRHRLMTVLRSNIDLGGIVLGEDYGGSIEEASAVAARIDALRPELPIILRRAGAANLDGLPAPLRQAVCATFNADDLDTLRAAVDEFIFSIDFPNALVRGISDITETRLGSLFKNLTVTWDTPSVVRDRIIFGEVFSLIPLEGAWCRGYMMMQTEERPLLEILGNGNGNGGVDPDGEPAGFRDINSLLGELTNLIWGAFKDRFLDQQNMAPRAVVQVPLLVNHKHRYISFGSNNPQLCFRYRLTDDNTGQSFTIDQRFVFSLSWSPEDFSEKTTDMDALVEAGELDLF
ncbi:chemotaxis protein CheX [Paraburkholderia sp.]|uniref:chemotaxis protein CheX n=1 Tax=Paraburkholderia sp. TaxID=1926495 RepID=UPI00238885D6|nr:chemotaxis protein CheX [Paraburkholderia sp.]MDE1184761.1 chemotaxis protein CheX [Paraburkholderia sp.]